MANRMRRLAFRMLSSALAVPVSRIVTRVVRHTWLAAKPDSAPLDPNKAVGKFADSVIYAMLTGAGAATTELIITRTSDGIWRGVTGTPVPAVKPRRGRVVRRTARPKFSPNAPRPEQASADAAPAHTARGEEAIATPALDTTTTATTET
jgi:hypothetical protein